MTQQKLQIYKLLCCSLGTFLLGLVLLLFYLKCKIVRTCDFFHYLTTINLETFKRISVTKVTCTDSFLHKSKVCVVTRVDWLEASDPPTWTFITIMFEQYSRPTSTYTKTVFKANILQIITCWNPPMIGFLPYIAVEMLMLFTLISVERLIVLYLVNCSLNLSTMA